MGAAANPAGSSNGGRAPEFDDQCPVPKTQQSQESKTFDYDYHPKKKKEQSSEQCKVEDNLNDMAEFGSILEGSVVPVE